MATIPSSESTCGPARSGSPSTLVERSPVPLAVWPAAQTSSPHQRTGRYLSASFAHPGKMLPALARRIIETYSTPGQLVVDPMCGIGTTLVEGAELGRRCLGVDIEERWATLARANLDHALPPEQRPLAEVRLGDARRLSELLADVAGTVDLIATSPPYACAVGTVDKSAWLAGRSLCDRASLNYSADRANIGYARDEAYLEEMAEVYAACHAVLRPGGLLVTVTKNLRRKGRCLDLGAATVTLAQQAGFSYLQHVIALLCAVRGSELVARPSFWQLTQNRKARAKGLPAHLVVHEDVLVFGGGARG
ncbi:MAG: TRM11 family SAM-dependent methyltransferase [Acidimicrobiales bacterium]